MSKMMEKALELKEKKMRTHYVNKHEVLNSEDMEGLLTAVCEGLREALKPGHTDAWIDFSFQYNGDENLLDFEYSYDRAATDAEYQVQLDKQTDEEFRQYTMYRSKSEKTAKAHPEFATRYEENKDG